MKKYIICAFLLTIRCLYAGDMATPSASDITPLPQPSAQDITTAPSATKPSPTPSKQPQPTTQGKQKPSDQKKSKAIFTANQITTPYLTPDGKPIKKTDYNRYKLPQAAQLTSILTANSNTFSKSKKLFLNYPPASLFFPHNTSLASGFAAMLHEIQNDQVFFLLIKRLHSIVLQQMYAYLKKIYVTIDLNFVNSTQDFLNAQATYALNTKKLIIHHLMNIVDGQSYQFSQSLFPNLDKNIATHTGSTLMNNDQMINLSWLLITQEQLTQEGASDTKKSQFQKWQKKYLNLLKTYFSFFKQFTSTISNPDPVQGSLGISQLVTCEQDIRSLTKKQATSGHAISPQFFFPSKGTIQAITLIPQLVKNLSTHTKSVPWPTQIVQAARAGTQPTNNVTGSSYNFPIAFFKDGTGKETTSSDGAQGLYMNMLSGGQLYEIELLAQPSWLNDGRSVITMVRGALGDFTALVGLNILDKETETVIKTAVSAL